ncbi:Selenide water dikinase [Candidatus Magnetoovum chiemensis]|nr:Selenide water dikinase [Candidatus Magnetoovum chiemensis]
MQTIDVITAVVNDPFVFGQIGAANSLSDAYAMGAAPLTALAFCGFPTCDYSTDVLKQVLSGALERINAARAVLIGGHTLDDQEFKFGLSVTATVDVNNILRCAGAQPKDLIILTKPLGSGILSTALKGRKLNDEQLSDAVKWMAQLNDKAGALAVKAGASACTDVTGFGFLGHALNMLKGASVDFVIQMRSIPVMPYVFDMIDYGMCPAGAYRNLSYASKNTDFSNAITDEMKLVLSDPQTSGGLLITIKEESLRVFESSDVFYRVVGEAVTGSGRIKVV